MAESKGIRTLYAWLLRLALPVYIFFFNKSEFKSIDLTNKVDLILLASLVLSILVLIGDFFRGESVTRISALLLIIVLVVGAIIIEGSFVFMIFPIFAALYFIIYGNNA